MVYKVEESLRDFNGWAGGAETLEKIRHYDIKNGSDYFQQLADLADEFFCGRCRKVGYRCKRLVMV